jgi:hypothetical protein
VASTAPAAVTATTTALDLRRVARSVAVADAATTTTTRGGGGGGSGGARADTGGAAAVSAATAAGQRVRGVVSALTGAARENCALHAEVAVLRRLSAHAHTHASTLRGPAVGVDAGGAEARLADATAAAAARELAEARAAAAALAGRVPELRERADALERRDRAVQGRLGELEAAAQVRNPRRDDDGAYFLPIPKTTDAHFSFLWLSLPFSRRLRRVRQR